MSSAYQEANLIIASALKFGINPSLAGIQALCSRLGNPEQSFVALQVAGTNGKTSTARYLAAAISAHGNKTGLYTSPALCDVEERLEIDGTVVSKSDFSQAVLAANAVADPNQPPTEFELITAAALWLFAKHGVDYAVLEVGLGGRWDATSVVTPKIAVLTGVDFDHTAILGNTIAAIAAEKAAIIKTGTTAVLAPTKPEALDVFVTQAQKVKAKVVFADSIDKTYQSQNQETALTATRELLGSGFNQDLAVEAVYGTKIPGRFEILQDKPLVLIDAAHNPQSAKHLAVALKSSGLLEPTESYPSPTLLLAVLSDKDAIGIIKALMIVFKKIAVTKTTNPRALEPEVLAAKVEQVSGIKPNLFVSVAEAINDLTVKNVPIIATGSITLAGEVKRLLTSGGCSDKINQ